ncbi:hypothetical protein AO073_21170 [Pseudomonas syringae ICMP 11293]|uniref:hypothetical protein n=1 Tax=Pseudomonas syringae TaxID=317 RepID=UPI000730E871|nr:hypothetical protein [Pseudomonas syringae]KTB94599.1 hypothetical protein AO073_21170 [Pseudomonas syringae ICMP 11293]
MQVLVIPMRRKGVALEPRERERYEAIQGNVIVRSTHCEYLGRHANIAWLDAGMPKEEKRLPELLDVTLATMAHNGFVLSGIEYVDGCAYAQSWWCRHP